MGVYMGVFNFFIVIPEIVASLGFGPLIRLLFGRDNPNAPLYVVMLGGVCMLIAAGCVALVREVVVNEATEADVLRADAHEPFTLPESAQPVPSTGLLDRR
jgi:maltose/moltooligosaccharide transporter